MNILAIIPARGGSKGIKRKNLRLLNKKPLIWYQIQNSIKSEFVSDVVVTSDDEDILNYASNFPVNLRKRPEQLASDQITLDPVINDAMIYMEFKTGKKYDAILTLQPTSPLLSFKTLDEAVERFINSDLETLIPVTDATHLYWKEDKCVVIPDYTERLNRQWLPKKYMETGAFLLTKRMFVDDNSRLGNNINIFVLDEIEGLDIDTDTDFLMAETVIRRLKIVFVVKGNKDVGMGHIYRSLTLADGFLGNEINFMTYESGSESIRLIKDRGYEVIETTKGFLLNKLEILCPDVIINDILDTDEEYIKKLKDLKYFVINFEDLGTGSNVAHLVFNALYEKTNPSSNHRFGHEYECLSDKFFLYPSIKFKNSPKILFITFGGVDQNNLTLKVLRTVPKLIEKTSLKKIVVVLGAGYSHNLNLDEFDLNLNSKVEIYSKVKNMPKLMSKADIAITSNGRTVYELASMAIPTLSIAQNDRETLHLFSRYNRGIKYLGISCTVSEDDIMSSIYEIANNKDLRQKMYFKQCEASIVIRNGLTRIMDEITSGYWKWKHEQ